FVGDPGQLDPFALVGAEQWAGLSYDPSASAVKGNVSGLLDRMVEAGLVERRSIPGDRRSNALFLTAKGRHLAERGIETQRAYVAQTLGTMEMRDLAELERLVLAWREKARAVEEELASQE
ncbi:MarR family winged helix-turn-helix transcriptional regulator, partial [Streptomyces albidoflavus]|uniref:MarR family winged helix-turn-helix transcriptional regulator n=1 Tax=Streptomyces albidoflavus TaxID=1886 RepID=UPI003F4DCBDE